MKKIRVFLLVLIIIGVGLLVTQKIWVPKIVDKILKSENIIISAPLSETVIQNKEVVLNNIPLVLRDKLDDKKVILKLDDGKEKVYENNYTEGWATFMVYDFIGYNKDINSYEISLSNYDGGMTYLLVNKSSGDEIYLPGEIIISPNKEKIFSYVASESADMNNGFAIVNLKDSHFQKELEINLNWFPVAANWASDTELEITKISSFEDFRSFNNAEVLPASASKIRYIYVNNKWIEKT
ncbi:MAG: hypothetical protein WC769_12640 [Thermodesulfovibrionales bacterium]|jgi:hypothetical protein